MSAAVASAPAGLSKEEGEDGMQPDEVEAWKKQIAALSSQALMTSTPQQQTPTITLTLYIPASSVGAVIGRRGQTIVSLQKSAQTAAAAYFSSSTSSSAVRISVVGKNPNAAGSGSGSEQQGPSPPHAGSAEASSSSTSSSTPYTFTPLDFSDPLWTPVVIRAEPVAAFCAAEKLTALVRRQQGAEDVEEQDVIVDVPIARTKHAVLVGKRGTCLASLSADSNVRIMVPNKTARQDLIQLEGELQRVQQCLAALLPIAAKCGGSGGTKGAANNKAAVTGEDATTPSSNVTTTIHIRQVPSQTRLRNVGRRTGCTLRKKKAPEGKGWQLTVTGPQQEQVDRAVALLQKQGNATEGEPANNDASTEAAAGSANNNPTTPPPQSSPTRRSNNKGRGSGRNKQQGRGKQGQKSAALTSSTSSSATTEQTTAPSSS